MRGMRGLARLIAILLLPGFLAAPAYALEAVDDSLPTLSPEEEAALAKGEVLLKTVTYSSEDRRAQAIGYVDSNPVELFNVLYDPKILPSMYPELKKFDEVARYPDGNEVDAVAGESFLFVTLRFKYHTRAWWSPVKDGITWKQLDGEFDKNEGSWRFYWDDEKKQTRVILTLALAFRGLLSLIPEWLIIRETKARMPQTIEKVRKKILEIRAQDPGKIEAMQKEWEGIMASGQPYLRVGGPAAPSAPPQPMPATSARSSTGAAPGPR